MDRITHSSMHIGTRDISAAGPKSRLTDEFKAEMGKVFDRLIPHLPPDKISELQDSLRIILKTPCVRKDVASSYNPGLLGISHGTDSKSSQIRSI